MPSLAFVPTTRGAGMTEGDLDARIAEVVTLLVEARRTLPPDVLDRVTGGVLVAIGDALDTATEERFRRPSRNVVRFPGRPPAGTGTDEDP